MPERAAVLAPPPAVAPLSASRVARRGAVGAVACGALGAAAWPLAPTWARVLWGAAVLGAAAAAWYALALAAVRRLRLGGPREDLPPLHPDAFAARARGAGFAWALAGFGVVVVIAWEVLRAVARRL